MGSGRRDQLPADVRRSLADRAPLHAAALPNDRPRAASWSREEGYTPVSPLPIHPWPYQPYSPATCVYPEATLRAFGGSSAAAQPEVRA